MASADAANQNEIIGGMAQNPIDVMGQQARIRIAPER
jgi:hypothetical protein